ncbi:hypothetical protein QFZ48_000184 [Chitinophaga sp. W2I13]|uniref:DUF3658 domain-containing protein n=1 Tax=Chitinophaga sp. W2I13 TaxID=3373923 RepID=UPI003D1B8039
MADVHIVSSLSGGGILSWAVKKRTLTGEVFAFNEIPGTGPLDDGAKRMAFLRSLNFNKENGNFWGGDSDSFARWRELQARLLAQPADRLVIWAGSDGNDYVFIRMACHWLERIPVNVMLVQAPPIVGYHSMAVYSFEELAPLINQAVLLPAAARSKLAREFEDIASRPELLRECDENGVLQFRELSAHDNLLLSHCDKRWKPAVRVIGQTIGFSDPRNSLGDGFVSSRLEHLIVNGQIEADGVRTSMRTFRVRLAKK